MTISSETETSMKVTLEGALDIRSGSNPNCIVVDLELKNKDGIYSSTEVQENDEDSGKDRGTPSKSTILIQKVNDKNYLVMANDTFMELNCGVNAFLNGIYSLKKEK